MFECEEGLALPRLGRRGGEEEKRGAVSAAAPSSPHPYCHVATWVMLCCAEERRAATALVCSCQHPKKC